MVSLYDANLWVALAFAAHPHHAIASRHFKARDSSQPTAFCRVTQQAFLRLVSTPLIQRTYASRIITNATAWSKCQDLLALPQILWLDEPEDQQSRLSDSRRVTSRRFPRTMPSRSGHRTQSAATSVQNW